MSKDSSTPRRALRSLASVGFVLAGAGCAASSQNAPTSASEAGASAASAGAAGSAAGTANARAGTSSVAGDGGAANPVASNAETGGSTSNAAGNASMASGGGNPAPVSLPPLVTSALGAYWKTDGQFKESAASNPDVTVLDAVVAQTWDGFGAAFNEQGWAALTSSQMQQQALGLLFSASDGAAFTWGRIPIGANDYALSRYTLDDTGADVTPESDESNRPAADPTLSMFSLARDEQALVPYVKGAQAVKPDLRFWASPWSPPVWMKTGFRKSDAWTDVKKPSYFDGGSMRSDAGTLAAYAQYFSKFVQGYKALGIDIELVAPQEEPSFEQSYPSCLWDQLTYSKFVGQFLGPTMTAAGVKVMLGTLADANKDLELAAATLADASAKSFSSVLGAQWDALGWENKLSDLHAALPVWATEHQGGNYPWNPADFPPYQSYAPNDQAYGVETWGRIRDAILKIKVTSYNAWNLVLDKNGWSIDTSRQWAQNALLVADSGSVIATPAYYVFRHLSQYVAPGATVLGTSGGDALAFKNPDGSLVAVLFNSGPANDHYLIAIAGKTFEFAMPSNGWATLQVKP